MKPYHTRGTEIDSRRVLILAAVLGVLLLPLVGEAQQAEKAPRIGVTLVGSPPSPYAEALRRGLAELGWFDGRNIVIEYRYAEGRRDRYAAFMADLIDLKVHVIVAGGGGSAVRAAVKATSVIPIVVPVMGDPVVSGLVRSMARPGGNLTGQSQVEADISAKRAELFKAILPRAERVAVLRDSGEEPRSAQNWVDPAVAAARSLGLRPQVVSASGVEDLEAAFAAAKAGGAEGLIVPASAFFNNHRQRIVDLSLRYRLVGVFENRGFAEVGGLISYGVNIAEMYRDAARYVDKILRGAKPADLPIEQATRFELVINLRTAKVLQVPIPQTLLIRADRVVE